MNRPATAPADDGLAATLARLAAGRDPRDWERVVALVGASTHRLAWRLTGDAMLAQDVVQEVLLQLRDHGGEFRLRDHADADRGARRWVARIAANTAWQLLRTRGRASARERRWEATRARPPVEDPQDAVARDESAALLRAAVADLPAAHREAVTLHYLAEVPLPELAEELSLSVDAARKRVQRGVEALRRRLGRLGAALSLAAVVGALTRAAASEPPAFAQPADGLLAHPPSPFHALPSRGFPMALKIALPLAAALVAGAVPFARSADSAGAPVADTPAVAAPNPGAPINPWTGQPGAPVDPRTGERAAAPSAPVAVTSTVISGWTVAAGDPQAPAQPGQAAAGEPQVAVQTLVIGEQGEDAGEATTVNVVGENGQTMTIRIAGDGDHVAGVAAAVAAATVADPGAPPAAATPAADPGLVPGVPVR